MKNLQILLRAGVHILTRTAMKSWQRNSPQGPQFPCQDKKRKSIRTWTDEIRKIESQGRSTFLVQWNATESSKIQKEWCVVWQSFKWFVSEQNKLHLVYTNQINSCRRYFFVILQGFIFLFLFLLFYYWSIFTFISNLVIIFWSFSWLYTT